MTSEKDYFKANEALWDAKTPTHVKSAFYNQEAFMNGETSLRKLELAELPDVRGKKLLHTQCHFGQDTLSLQRMGAQCTGVDFSGVALEKAREMNDALGLSARFLRTNIYDLDKVDNSLYDMVFTSYGVITWLPDLERWAAQLMARLAQGGEFLMVEFHPVIYMLDWDKATFAYRYFNDGSPYEEEEEGTYADPSAVIRKKEYFWQHPLSDVMSALMLHGLEVTSFKEYDYSPYDVFPGSAHRAELEYCYSVNGITLPHVFSLKGIKK